MASIVQIQLRRDTAANWTTNNPILLQGEPALETDTGRLKFGDGTTAYNSLAYFDTDKTFNFVQGVAATVWNINHNLGKFPSVSIFDSADTPLIGQIEHIDDNNVEINFNKAVSGKAYLN
jgi:hypothetical protein